MFSWLFERGISSSAIEELCGAFGCACRRRCCSDMPICAFISPTHDRFNGGGSICNAYGRVIKCDQNWHSQLISYRYDTATHVPRSLASITSGRSGSPTHTPPVSL